MRSILAALAVASLVTASKAAVVVVDFEDVAVGPGNTLLAGKTGPEYAANGFTVDNVGTVYGPSALYAVGAINGYASTALYPQYNQPIEIRRADGATFDFASLDVATDPQKKGGTGTLVALAADGSTIGTVAFAYGTNPAVATTVVGNFAGVAAVRVSFAGNLDAARGTIDNVAIVPEPVLALAAAVTVGVGRRWRRRLARART